MTTHRHPSQLEVRMCANCPNWVCRHPGELWRHLATGSRWCGGPRSASGEARPRERGQAA